MKSLLLLFVVGLVSTNLFSQTYNMPSGTNTVTTCSGTFYDSGGSGSNYGYGESRTYTFCPGIAGDKIRVNFSAFAIENGYDFLYVYDGINTAAPSLGVYSGTSGPGIVQATPSNASGCVTFRFTSDGNFIFPSTDVGWTAAISCIVPCQTITANWVSSNEAPMGDGVIRICQGQSVNFVGSGTFSSSGVGATYSWSMGNGTNVSGTNINYTYPVAGSFLVNLTITDPSGCTNANSINRNVQVSTTPTLTTSATPSTLCTNQTSALGATVTMNPYNVNCTPPVSGTTFLPDGSGVSYQTSIVTSCYTTGGTITAASDITNICLNMEHSYLGDLSITIQCPNGQTADLESYGGGGGSANLGTPWATGAVDGSSSTTTAGTGANYCFSSSGATTLIGGIVSGGTFPNGNGPGTYSDSYVPAGNYLPSQSFTNLIGCPLNGSWTILVTDHLAADNGYIFNWDINFNTALQAVPSFTPTIASQGWVAATTLTSTGATTANVVPTNQGAPCFTYSVTDNFGCTYTAPQCITVNCGTSLPVGLIGFEASATTSETVQLDWATSSETNSDYYNIERSIDGVVWELLDQVGAMGNSTVNHEYRSFDNKPYLGTSYYRLSQYDLNGGVAETDMEAVYLKTNIEANLNVFPNPATTLVSVQGDLISLSTFELTNNIGQNVKDKVVIYGQGDDKVVLDLQSLETGIYFIKYAGGSIPLIKI